MALIKCEDCEKEYSDKATECPNCGCPTISNTISKKREKIEACAVEIQGYERLHPRNFLNGLLVFITILFAWIATLVINKHDHSNIFPGEFQLLLFIMIFLSPFLALLLPSYKKKAKKSKTIYEYFKKRFVLLNDIQIARLGLATIAKITFTTNL